MGRYQQHDVLKIEAIPYQSILDQLQQLPHASNTKPSRGSIGRLAFLESNASGPGGSTKVAEPMKLAKSASTKPRLKVDYDLLSSSTNLTLQGDTTYFVTGAVNITGTTTIEGGTVVKYTNSATAEIVATNIVCLTAAYSPGVFTDANDNSVGSPISGSSGSPSRNAATYFNCGTLPASLLFRYVRCSFASNAIYATISSTANSVTNWDCQFVNCSTAFNANLTSSGAGFPLYIYNVLFASCTNAIYFLQKAENYINLSAINVTADQIGSFIPSEGPATAVAVNSIFTAVTNLNLTSTSCASSGSGAGVYQIVGAASYYLASGSTNRDAGTSGINSALLADLQTLTTYPPVVVPAGWLATNCTFFPQAQRDTDTLDLGYHYNPIDFAIDIAVSNATVTVLPGTVLAGYGNQYGVYLFTNGVLNCAGTATSPNYLVQYNTVQEQSNTNWESTAWDGLLLTPDEADSSSANVAFTDWSVLAGANQISGQSVACPVALESCQLYTGYINGTGPVMTATR